VVGRVFWLVGLASLVAGFLVVAPTVGWAAEAAKPAFGPLPLWPAAAPGEVAGEVGPERAVPSKPGQKPVLRIHNVTRPTLEVWAPPREKATGAAVVVCPGGGYHILAWDLEGTEVCRWLNSLGVAGVLLKYRVPRRKGRPKHEAPLQDAQRAVRLVRAHAKQWGIDPDRVGILGFSAGGHLAAVASTCFDRPAYEPVDEADRLPPRPDFAVLVYPAYLVTDERAEVPRLAPEVRVSRQTPPTFLVVAGDDHFAPSSLFYYRALRTAGVPAELHIYPRGGHGFGLRADGPPVARAWPRLCEAWMRRLGVLDRQRGG